MTNRVIDADGHICEPPAVWNDYVEKRHRAANSVNSSIQRKLAQKRPPRD